MSDSFSRLLNEGFTHITIDLSKSVHLVTWNKRDRRTHWAKAKDPETAVNELIGKARAKPAKAMFDDLLG